MNFRLLFGAAASLFFVVPAVIESTEMGPEVEPEADGDVSTALPDPQETSEGWLTELRWEHRRVCALSLIWGDQARLEAIQDEALQIRARYNLPGACEGAKYFNDRNRCGVISCAW